MRESLLVLGIMALGGWITALPMLLWRKAPARLRLTMAVLPLGMLLVPFPLFCRRTVTIPAVTPQIYLPSGELPLPGEALPSPVTEEPAFAVGAELIWTFWLVGTAVSLLAQLAGWISLRQHLSEQRPVSREIAQILDELCTGMHIRIKPRIAFSPAADTPLLTGFFRPVILLPEGDYLPEELRLILRHELTHHKQGHLFVQALARLAAAVHWFHPLGHLLVKLLPGICEAACDETVAAALDKEQRKHYGLVILRFAGRKTAGGCAALAALRGKDPRLDMERRLKAVMNPRHISPKLRLLAGSLAAAVLLAGCGVSYKIAPASVKLDETSAPAETVSEPSSEVTPPSSEPAAESSAPSSEESAEPENEVVSGEELPVYETVPKSEESGSEPAPGPSEEQDAPDPGLNNEAGEEEYIKATHYSAFCWPLPGHTTISSHYGGSHNHTGIDITGENVAGSPVAAWWSGTVLSAGYDAQHGNCVLIDHGDGLCSFYAHCESLAVKEGEEVSVGQTIAAAGTTGMSTGPHLHFELRQDGESIDPTPYMTDIIVCSYPTEENLHHTDQHHETHKQC